MDSLLKVALLAFEKRGVTDEDIAKFKGSIESQNINRLQSVQGKGATLASFQTLAGNPNMIGQLLDRYNAVTKEDVWRVYNEYIKDKHSVTVSVITKGQDKDKMVAAADNYKIDSSNYARPNYGYEGLAYLKGKDNFDRSKLPGNGPNPVVKVPPF